MFQAAAIQMCSTASKEENLAVALELVREAAAKGARFVSLPETFLAMGTGREQLRAVEPLDGPALTALSALAQTLRIHLLAGSVLEPGAPGGRYFNSSLLFGPGGDRLALYRKLHLFDAALGDSSPRYAESAMVAPGDEIVSAKTPLGHFGLSICYDLRFPELYRELSRRGAELLCVPSAFTLQTGRAHWKVLLRARAIENLSFVIAAAQAGENARGRRTYGHALICDPWGEVLAEVDSEEACGIALAPIDLERLANLRRELPALSHRRLPLERHNPL